MSEPRDTATPDADDARIADLLRSLTDDDQQLLTPPDTVWAGIEQEAFGGPFRDLSDGPALAPVVPLVARRRRHAVVAGAVAAALVLVAAVSAVLLTGDDDPAYEVVSTADLVWQAEFDEAGVDARASASLLEDGEALFVRIDEAALPEAADDTDLELWLIGLDGDDDPVIQTLGLVADPADPGLFAVPAEFGTAGFDTVAVDISIEPRDGDASHSGRSIVRGPLEA